MFVMAAAAVTQAVTVDVQNRFGAVTVKVADQQQLTVRGVRDGQNLPSSETSVSRRMDRVMVRATPGDGGPMDLELILPIGWDLDAQTADGALSIEGMLPRSRLVTENGPLILSDNILYE